MLPDLRHGPEGEILLLIVDQPGRALRDVVQTEHEGDQKDEGREAQPVPGEAAAHEVADDDAEGGHHLGEGAADVPHVGAARLVDVDRGDGDLQPGAQTQQEPAHIELPGLGGGHQQRPADKQRHDGEGEQRGLPAHGVHQEDGGEGAEQGPDAEETAWIQKKYILSPLCGNEVNDQCYEVMEGPWDQSIKLLCVTNWGRGGATIVL